MNGGDAATATVARILIRRIGDPPITVVRLIGGAFVLPSDTVSIAAVWSSTTIAA